MSEENRIIIKYTKGYTQKKEMLTKTMNICEHIRGVLQSLNIRDMISVTQKPEKYSITKKPTTFDAVIYAKNKDTIFCKTETWPLTITFAELITGEISINPIK